jgi:hypothetical protein
MYRINRYWTVNKRHIKQEFSAELLSHSSCRVWRFLRIRQNHNSYHNRMQKYNNTGFKTNEVTVCYFTLLRYKGVNFSIFECECRAMFLVGLKT